MTKYARAAGNEAKAAKVRCAGWSVFRPVSWMPAC